MTGGPLGRGTGAARLPPRPGRLRPHAARSAVAGGARTAVSFVLNIEEGGESSVLHGDPASETFLSEIVNAQAVPGRHLSMESLYEYGSRAGVSGCCACSPIGACR